MDRLPARLLAVGVAAYAIAIAWRSAHGTSPLFGVLFVGADWSEDAVLGLLSGVAIGLAAAVLALFGGPSLRRVGLALVGMWATVLTVAMVVDGVFAPWAKPLSQASRWAPPFVLLVWPSLGLSPRPSRLVSVMPRRLLALAAAATFVGHAWGAWQLRGEFLDFIFTAGSWVGLGVSEAHASVVLRVIAVHDVVLGVGLVACCWGVVGRPVCGWAIGTWMAVWGAATASMRIGHGGAGMWPEALERVPNALVPLVVVLLCDRQRKLAV